MLRALLVQWLNLVNSSVLRRVLAMPADVTNVLPLAVIARRLGTNVRQRPAAIVPQRLAEIAAMNVRQRPAAIVPQRLAEIAAMNVRQRVVMNVRRNVVGVRRTALWLAPTAGARNERPPRPSTRDVNLHRVMMITGRSLMVGFGKMMLRKSQRCLVLLWPPKILMTKTLMMTL